MALFEFERGRLIPAQFGHPVDHGLEPDILEAIRTQVLEVIERPLFPVTWHNNEDPNQYRLTALDASGQVVAVELLSRLDPVSLISALSRLGDIAALGWMELATRYPGGPEAFRSGWAEFREAMPPNTQPGPRLILVVGEIDEAVRPALGVLFQSGLEIHEVHLREMSNGRRFLEVMQVRVEVAALSRQLGSRASSPAQITWGNSDKADSGVVEGEPHDSTNQLAQGDSAEEDRISEAKKLFGEDYDEAGPSIAVAVPEDATEEADDGEPVSDDSSESEVEPETVDQPEEEGSEDAAEIEKDESEPEPQLEGSDSDELQDTIIAPVTDAPPPPDAVQIEEDQPEETEEVIEPPSDTNEVATVVVAEESVEEDLPDKDDAQAEKDSSVERKRRKPEHVAEREPIPGIIGLNAEGLFAIAQVIGQDARLLWNDGETLFEATLNSDGTIDCGNGFSTTDVEESLLKVTGRGDLIAWKSWRIGHEDGPTLAEAIDEINAEIYRETMAAQQG